MDWLIILGLLALIVGMVALAWEFRAPTDI
jgi:hypothetical protein